MFKSAREFIVGFFFLVVVLFIIGAVIVAIAANQTGGDPTALGNQAKDTIAPVLHFLKGLFGLDNQQA